MPTVYIGKSQEDYSSGSSSINAPGGNATTTLYAYTKTGTPTSYSWNAEFYGECDRWYTYPSGNRLDVSVYLTPNITVDIFASPAQCIMEVL